MTAPSSLLGGVVQRFNDPFGASAPGAQGANPEVVLSRQDYIDNILDHHDQPRNRRVIPNADIQASGGNPGCGDIVVIYATFGFDGRIQDAAFQGEGCTISQAGASMLTGELVGKTADEVSAMSFQDVVDEMGKDVVASRTRCATLAISTAKAAVSDYQRRQLAGDGGKQRDP